MNLTDVKGLVHVFKIRGLMKIIKLAKRKDEDFTKKMKDLEAIMKDETDLPDRFEKTIEFQVSIGNLRGIYAGRELERKNLALHTAMERRTIEGEEALNAIHQLVTDIKKYVDVYGQLVK